MSSRWIASARAFVGEWMIWSRVLLEVDVASHRVALEIVCCVCAPHSQADTVAHRAAPRRMFW